jgi:hypothetical protein
VETFKEQDLLQEDPDFSAYLEALQEDSKVSQENWAARWARAARCWRLAALRGRAAVVALAVYGM